MIEKIISLLEMFFEKYFIPSLISIIPTAVAYYFTPDDFKVLVKLGKDFYLLVLFVIFLLIIQLIIISYRKIIKTINAEETTMKYESEMWEKNIADFRKLVDSLSPQERKLLNYFLDNNNQEYIVSDNSFYFDNKLLRDYCDTNRTSLDAETRTIDPYTLETIVFVKGHYVTRYKLKKDFYELLKYMKDNDINISNF